MILFLGDRYSNHCFKKESPNSKKESGKSAKGLGWTDLSGAS
ncbi:hypothetical protein ACKFKG_02610 [Phormidesmis sp. 146-35]